MLCAVLLGQLDDHGRQSQQGDKVRNGHAGVEGIGYIPCKAQVHGSANHYDDAEQNLVGLDHLGAEQILCTAGAVEAPAEYGGTREEREADCNYYRSELAVGS